MYNQKITQLEFNDYFTQSDWEADCASCAALTNPSASDHVCLTCTAFAPQTTTYNYFNLLFYILIAIMPFAIIAFFRRKK